MKISNQIFEILQQDSSFSQIVHSLVEASIEKSFNGIMITTADPDYPIIYVNPAFCDMTGYTPEDVAGESPAILQGPKTDETVLVRLRNDIQQGSTFHGRAINYRKDGSEFLMEWKIAPLRNSENEITHYMAIQRTLA